MKGYHISIYRHGLTRANDEGIYIGSTDYPLSEEGAAELCGRLDQYAYPRVQQVYSSPLMRCTETADILFPDVPLTIEENLREMNFGVFEGKSTEELLKNKDFHAWLKERSQEARPPEGESVAELTLRSYQALHRILLDMMEHDYSHCAIITHGGVLSNLIGCFGLQKLCPEDLQVQPGEGFELLFTAQLWQQAHAFEILGLSPYIR